MYNHQQQQAPYPGPYPQQHNQQPLSYAQQYQQNPQSQQQPSYPQQQQQQHPHAPVHPQQQQPPPTHPQQQQQWHQHQPNQQQPHPPPVENNMNGLSSSMSQMHVNPSQPYPQQQQQQQQPQPQQQQFGHHQSNDPSPPPPHPPNSTSPPQQRKRPARVYHDYLSQQAPPQQQQQSSPAPPTSGPSPQQQVQQNLPPSDPQNPHLQQHYHQQQPQQQQQQPHPHPYANAPPPGPVPLPVQPPGDDIPGPTHIRQPPHSGGQNLTGPRARIDDEAMPSAVAVREQDQHKWDHDSYLTCSDAAVPLATTDFIAIDQGNSNPRFIRATTDSIPLSQEISNQSSLPLGLIVQPFAKLKPEEGDRVPLADFSHSGPPRCSKCRGYINPWCNFIDGGQKFVCNLCGDASKIPQEYFAHLDINGRRTDIESRPELTRGSVDFIVPQDYWHLDEPSSTLASSLASSTTAANSKNHTTSGLSSSTSSTEPTPRPPKPMVRIFALDVTFTSIKQNVLAQSVRSIRQLLYGPSSQDEKDESTTSPSSSSSSSSTTPALESLAPGTKIAIMTFDRTVHFYNLHPNLDQAQMLVVGDIEDMFVPINDGFLVDVHESRHVIEKLLDSLETMFQANTSIEPVLGGVVGAAMTSLQNLGGQLNVFLCSLPTLGPGALKHREDSNLYGTDKEKNLFSPQITYYRQVAEEFAQAGIVVNLFLFPLQYIDIASIGVLSGMTGGDVFFFVRFDPVRDRLRLKSTISQVLTRETAYNATMRIRCSNGLRITDHFGNFFQRNVTDLEFGAIDADKAIAARIRHEGKLSEKGDAYFQCAVLYTSTSGQRRVRCHNICVQVTKLVSTIFSTACMETIMAYLAKEAISNTISKSLRDVRESVTERCVKSLWSYRKYCAKSSVPGQMLLPECVKLFPIYALCLAKTKAIKGGPVTSDFRTHYMRLIKSMGVAPTINLLYPNMFAIHQLTPEMGMPAQDGRIILPPKIRLSHTRMYAHGIYFIENGEVAIIWIGSQASPQLVEDIYGVDVQSLDIKMGSLPKLPTLVSQQLRNIISTLEAERNGKTLHVLFARQDQDGTEIEFSNMLSEDSNNDSYSYTDYICHIHRLITEEAKNEKYSDEMDAGSNWQGTW